MSLAQVRQTTATERVQSWRLDSQSAYQNYTTFFRATYPYPMTQSLVSVHRALVIEVTNLAPARPSRRHFPPPRQPPRKIHQRRVERLDFFHVAHGRAVLERH